MMRVMHAHRIRLALLFLMAGPASAADQWSAPHPGVERLFRTTPAPNRIHALRIDLCRDGVQVRATRSGERRQTPSAFARAVGAQVAINGDFFSYDGYGTTGLSIGDGDHWPGTSDSEAAGYVAFGFDRVEFSGSGERRGPEPWMREVVSGLGVIVEDGVAVERAPARPSHCSARHPRTAMGLSRDRRTLHLVVVDGRSGSSRGMNCVELGRLMRELGAWDAVNLDGGGSSALWVEGPGVVNRPSDGSQRVVANHLAVFARGSGEARHCDRSVEEAAYPLAGRGASTTTDLDGDGYPEVCGLGPEGVECARNDGAGRFEPVRVGPPLASGSGWGDPANASTLRFGDVDGDGRADLCVRANGGVLCYLYDGEPFARRIEGPALSDDTGWGALRHGATMHLADVNGDGLDDLCARAAAGHRCWPSTGDGFADPLPLDALANDDGFESPDTWGTIRAGDIDGDGRDDLCARTPAGMRCWRALGDGFEGPIEGPRWDDAGGWNRLPYWASIRLTDVDGDGRADLCARGVSGVRCHLSDGDRFGPASPDGLWPDAEGWADPDNATTWRLGDLDGDGDLDACARSNRGVRCALWDGAAFVGSLAGPDWSDEGDWDRRRYHATLHLLDLDGDARADICGRGYGGLRCARSIGEGFDETIAGPGWGDETGWGAEVRYATIQAAPARGGPRDAATPDALPEPDRRPDASGPDEGGDAPRDAAVTDRRGDGGGPPTTSPDDAGSTPRAYDPFADGDARPAASAEGVRGDGGCGTALGPRPDGPWGPLLLALALARVRRRVGA
jgi:hypothetical protein